MSTTQTTSKINFTRINNDVNGNPRYVCHFLNLITDADKSKIKEDFAGSLNRNSFLLTVFMYDLAISKAKKIGGKKYNNKSYSGGIVFQEYNEHDMVRLIKSVL